MIYNFKLATEVTELRVSGIFSNTVFEVKNSFFFLHVYHFIYIHLFLYTMTDIEEILVLVTFSGPQIRPTARVRLHSCQMYFASLPNQRIFAQSLKCESVFFLLIMYLPHAFIHTILLIHVCKYIYIYNIYNIFLLF